MPRILFLSILFLASGLWILPSARAERRPNILFVLSDDHSVPFLGCYDYPIKTPNLDRAAAEGLRLDRFFTAAPQCVPSRASLMTGRSPCSARISRFSSPLDPALPTLPGALRAAGYRTGVCGRSYHLDGSSKKERAPEYHKALDRHDLRRFKDNFDFVNVQGGSGIAAGLVERFFEETDSSKPFFLWVNYTDPHHPWNTGKGTNKPDDLRVPPYLPDTPLVRKALAAHCDEISSADTDFGVIREVLEKRKLFDNTLVIFMGDNGLALPHGKGSLFDPGLNVPCIMRWPGVIKPGRSSDTLLSGTDFLPTLLDLAGAAIPEGVRGISFASLVKGAPFEGREFIFGERGPHGGPPWTSPRQPMPASALDYSRCVRSKDWKLIVNYTPSHIYGPADSAGLPYWKEMRKLHGNGQLDPNLSRLYFDTPRPNWELYDLTKDPHELENVFNQAANKPVINQLKTALLEEMVLNYDFLPVPVPSN